MLASSAGSIARELPGKCPGIARETGGHARDVLPWSPVLVDTMITQRPSTIPPVGAELAGRIVRFIHTLTADVVNGVCPNSFASVVPIVLPNSSSSSNADEPHVSRFLAAAHRSGATERQFGEDETIHQGKNRTMPRPHSNGLECLCLSSVHGNSAQRARTDPRRRVRSPPEKARSTTTTRVLSTQHCQRGDSIQQETEFRTVAPNFRHVCGSSSASIWKPGFRRGGTRPGL